MKKFSIFWIMFFTITALAFGQPLGDLRFCIDPGHGGHESDDRFIAETGFWESESNFEKALFLKPMLENLGATVVLTRTGNDDDVADDPSLSQRVAIANSNNVDFFHSIHSNGSLEHTANYTLLLYREVGGVPAWPQALDMCNIMSPKIFQTNRTMTQYVSGDYSWLLYNLGVLNGLLMPGTLSEGSFHDYLPESWRLMNADYRKNEAHAITRSFVQYYNGAADTLGIIAGIIRDSDRIVDYYYIPSSNDYLVPVNRVTVTLNPGGRTYTGDQMNNGFFLFDSLKPGSYQLISEAQGYGSDTSAVEVSGSQVAFADQYLQPFTPDTPSFVRILWESATSLRVLCDTADRAAAYTVFYGTDGVNFPDSASSAEPDIAVSGLETDSVYYFRILATNQSGSSQLSREVYAGIPSQELHRVLIVNGFDRSTNTRFDYIRKYADPVNSQGYPFSYTLNESVQSGRVSLLGFETVIWILGDESTADSTFTPAEQSHVRAFLEGGGNLFVSGAEIGWDLVARGSSADQNFYRDYLKAQYIADAPAGQQNTYYLCTPLAGELFHGIADFNFDNGTQGTYQVDWPDAIQGVDGARNILLYKNAPTSNISGISYEGLFGDGSGAGKLVYLSFPFETIYPDSSRFKIMERIFDFFEAPLSIESENPASIPGNMVLYQNYPNPFNPLTSIEFQINQAGNTNLSVFDNNGRLVEVLMNDFLSPGKYRVSFNGKDLASGIYFCVLQSPSLRLTRRMVLLK